MWRKLILNSSTAFIFAWNIFAWNIFASINFDSIEFTSLFWGASKVEFYFFLEIRNLLIIFDQIGFFGFIKIQCLKPYRYARREKKS